MQNSLHYLDPNGYFNKYEEAVSSVIGIIEAYGWDQQFPTFGFGAQYPRMGGMLLPEFNIRLDNMNCFGVQGTELVIVIFSMFICYRTNSYSFSLSRTGVLDAYRACASNIEPGPAANFTPVIQRAMQSMTSVDQMDYYFLLIFTAGQISDILQAEQVRLEEMLLTSAPILGLQS